jgi:hypothetical protein
LKQCNQRDEHVCFVRTLNIKIQWSKCFIIITWNNSWADWLHNQVILILPVEALPSSQYHSLTHLLDCSTAHLLSYNTSTHSAKTYVNSLNYSDSDTWD